MQVFGIKPTTFVLLDADKCSVSLTPENQPAGPVNGEDQHHWEAKMLLQWWELLLTL